MGLFDEFISCPDCPKVEALDNSNEEDIRLHVAKAHRGASMNAYIIAVAKRCADIRSWVQDTYDEARVYLDSDFSSNFLVDFEQRCWELSVYRYLVDNNINIDTPTQTAGPDFSTAIGYVECIAVKRGEGANAIPLLEAAVIHEDGSITGEVEAQPVPKNEAQLRIAHGMSEKIKKYKGYVTKDWFDQGKQRLIALNWWSDGASFGVGSMLDVSYDPVLRTLFGTSEVRLTIDLETGRIANQQPTRQLTVRKANGTEIDVHYFAKEAESDDERIDGVISSAEAPFIYHGTDFRIVNNAFGKDIEINSFSVGHKIKTDLSDTGFNVTML